MGVAVPGEWVVKAAESLVHLHGVIPSLTVLDTLMLQEMEQRVGTLSEADEIKTMIASKLPKLFSGQVLVLSDVAALEGGPTVLVSLRRFPEADLEFVMEHLSPLEALGSKRDRQDALEVPVAEVLTSLLTPYGFRVDKRSDVFHSVSNDIAVIGPAKRMFNIELRNRRSDIHDRLRRVDADAIKRDQRLGITTMFVVPRATGRFRRNVAGLGGVVVETKVYVTATEEQRAALAGFTWMAWPVELATKAAPRIADQIAAVILTDADALLRPSDDASRTGPSTSEPMSEGEIEAEGDRYLATMIRRQQKAANAVASAHRVSRAFELHRQGVTTMGAAADRMGISVRTLQRAFTAAGQRSPWLHGGRRRGAGRKSS